MTSTTDTTMETYNNTTMETTRDKECPSRISSFSLSALEAVLNHPSYILVSLVPIQLIIHILFTSKRKRVFPGNVQFWAHSFALTLVLVILTSLKPIDISFVHSNNSRSVVDILFAPTKNQTISYIAVVFVNILEKIGALSMKLPLFLFWFVTAISLSLDLYPHHVVIDTNGMDLMDICIDWITVSIVISHCLLSYLKGKSEEYVRDTSADTLVHPQDEASWFGDFTLQWTSKFVRITSERTMLHSDVYELAARDQCRNVAGCFEKNLKIENMKGLDVTSELSHRNKNLNEQEKPTNAARIPKKRISLLKVLLKTFGFKFFLLQSLEGMAEMAEFVNPVLMRVFMNHIKNREKEHWTIGLACVCGIFLVNGFIHIFHRRIWATTCRLLKQIRGSITISIFKKSLSIKNECMKDLTTGEIVNLISDDIDKIYDASQESFRLFSTPVTIGVSMYLLYDLIGYAVFVGLVMMIIFIPLNRYIGNSFNRLYTEKDRARYKRTKLMHEIISGIKLLKLYAWEQPFMQKVRDIRSREERCNDSISLFRAGLESMFRAIPFLVKISSFGVFMLFGGRLDATTSFVTMHLFDILNDPISSLATLIPEYIEAGASLRRINKFLSGDDIPRDIVAKKLKSNSAVSISNGEFAWDRNGGIGILRNINVNIPQGCLTAVVGTVGSGKSSFLAAILGEMEKLKGVVEVKGRVAYVSQEAWIQNTTLQDNILFGLPLDLDRYRRVIDACALKPDIDSMRAGDQTEIGEKGINLSGGQKQRVSLARALYNDADLYIFDDALSAVDAHVGKHIFTDAIGHNGILKGKTRILVTHGLHFLPHVDSIIIIDDGQVHWEGTYDRLVSRKGSDAQLLQNLRINTSGNDGPRANKRKRNSSTGCPTDWSGHDSSVVTSTNDSSDDQSDGDNDDQSGDESFDDIDRRTDKAGILIKDEEMEEGRVKMEVYIEYLYAVGHWLALSFVILFLLSSLFDAYSSHLLRQWTDDPRLQDDSSNYTSDARNKVEWSYFRWYSIAGAIKVIGTFMYTLIVHRGTFNASTRLHNTLLYRILRCPMSFFDTTPTSRILTRFSKDVSRVDGLGSYLQDLMSDFFNIFTFLAMIVIHCPSVSYYLITLSVVYFFLYKFYHGSVRQLKRYMSKYKPPICSHFSETLDGMATVRAYNCQSRFIIKMEKHIDEFTKYDLMEMWCELSLTLRSGLLCHLVTLIAGLICLFDTRMTAGMAALILMYTDDVSDSMDQFCWGLAMSETNFVSLEKMIEYSKKTPEPEWEIPETKPPKEWPRKGSICFKDYSARYRDGLDLVLKRVQCVINPEEKIGIVGRTGAGKTSLTMALFRLLETDYGSIVVDGVKIADIGLHTLRSRVNIIPQDPVIFSGTIKMNLDPFGEWSEDKIWNALKRSHLASFVDSLPHKLEFVCGGGGKNLSAGQRQLLCLARSLLRKTRILVLDEATAAVDKETDELIQNTLRTEFKDCTVLTVAHRINTLQDYDRIIVMDQGSVKEFDTPRNLLLDQNSIFHGMAKDMDLSDKAERAF